MELLCCYASAGLCVTPVAAERQYAGSSERGARSLGFTKAHLGFIQDSNVGQGSGRNRKKPEETGEPFFRQL